MGSNCSQFEEKTNESPNETHYDYTKGTVWSQKRNHQTCIIRNTPFCIGKYIYYLTDHQHGENGIVVYDTKSNKFETLAIYTHQPVSFTPCFHSYTYYNGKIYIISGATNQIFVYDLKSNIINSAQKNLESVKILHEIGNFSTSITIEGNIHILGGHNNTYIHKIYDIKNNMVYKPNKKKIFPIESIHNPAVVYINKLNKVFLFGGYDGVRCVALDGFYSSSFIFGDDFIASLKMALLDKGFPSDVMHIILQYMIDDNEELDILWTQNKSATLPVSLSRCGYILYNNCIFSFGGYTNHQYTAKIYCLNTLDIDNGWKQLKNIECPLAGCYHAVLVQNKMVHLFTRSNNVETPQHFAVTVTNLLEPITSKIYSFISTMR